MVIKYYCIFILPLLLWAGCHGKKETEVYDYYSFKKAWSHKDTGYIRRWILQYDTIPFRELVSRNNTLANKSNFCYGYLDEESKIESHEQNIIRKNIISVYNQYVKSCLIFNDKIPFDSTLYIKEIFWSSTRLLNERDMEQLNREFLKVCSKKYPVEE